MYRCWADPVSTESGGRRLFPVPFALIAPRHGRLGCENRSRHLLAHILPFIFAELQRPDFTEPFFWRWFWNMTCCCLTHRSPASDAEPRSGAPRQGFWQCSLPWDSEVQMAILCCLNNGKKPTATTGTIPWWPLVTSEMSHTHRAFGFGRTINGLGKMKLTLMRTEVIFCLYTIRFHVTKS